MPELAEREAVKLLAGVGNNREWWTHRKGLYVPVSDLRVGLTNDELDTMMAACNGTVPPVTDDAGESGPERPRTPPR